MESIWIDLGISALITLLREKIPGDGSSKNKYKKVMLKVFKAIAAAYKDDDDFKIKS
jgi:hypothetical protein